MSKPELAELFDAATNEIHSTLFPILKRIEKQHGEQIAINVAMNMGANILAEAVGLLKNSSQREAIFIHHVVNMAHNIELAVCENTARELIHKVKKETKP